MYKYHIPPRRPPKTDDGYFEVLSQSVFQAGFSWPVVRSKWSHFKKVFNDFDIKKVAQFTEDDLGRLMNDRGIIRNLTKIKAVIENARIVQQLQREFGSFEKFIKSSRGLPYRQRCQTLTKTFRWIGPTGVFHFFWCIGEDVPKWEQRND